MSDTTYGHYTSGAGLIGILRDEQIRATNIKFLNDEHEFQHAVDLIKQLTPRQMGETSPIGVLFKEYMAKLDSMLSTFSSFHAEQAFTFSFSEQPDLLSQWRGYCPANNGYCIVFDAEGLLAEIKAQYPATHLVKCVYDLGDKDKQLRSILNAHWNRYAALAEKDNRKEVIDELITKLMLLATYFKHPSFKEEQEHRVVTLLEDSYEEKIEFREGRSSLVPYINIKAPRKFIKRIVIGPNVNQGLARRALETLLEQSFKRPMFILDDLEIELSGTPYRPA